MIYLILNLFIILLIIFQIISLFAGPESAAGRNLLYN